MKIIGLGFKQITFKCRTQTDPSVAVASTSITIKVSLGNNEQSNDALKTATCGLSSAGSSDPSLDDTLSAEAISSILFSRSVIDITEPFCFKGNVTSELIS